MAENDEETPLCEKKSEYEHCNNGKPSVTRQRLTLIALLCLQFCHLTTDSFLIPFYPQEAYSKGLGQFHVGVVYSAYELARFLSAPIFGSVVAKIQPRRMCIIGSLLSSLTCVSFGLLALCEDSTLFFVLCIVIRLISGCAAVMISVSVTCILLKSNVFNTSTVIGFIELVLGAAYAVGPGLGAGLYQIGGYMPTFWMVGGASAIFTSVIYFIPETEEKGADTHNFVDMLKIPGVLLLFISITVLKIGLIGSGTVITTFIVDQYDVSPSTVGIGWTVWAVGYMAMCPVAAVLCKKGYIWSMMLSVWFTLVLVYLFMAPSPILNFIFHGYRNFWIPMVLMFISYSIQAGVLIPPFQAALDLVVVNGYKGDNLKTYGMITGMINSAIGLGSTAGPLSGGALVQYITYDWYSTMISVAYLIMLIVNATFLIYMTTRSLPIRRKLP